MLLKGDARSAMNEAMGVQRGGDVQIEQSRKRAWPLIAVLLLSVNGVCPAAEQPKLPDDVVLVHNLHYRDGTSKSWVLDLARPRQPEAARSPAIVVIHGGGWLEGDKSSFSSLDRAPPGNIIDFARLGFVAVTINYRLSGEARFPAALEDCQCAVRWLRSRADEYHIDPERIGALGNSAGGHLALLLGMTEADPSVADDRPWSKFSSRVQAVVSDSGPVDLVAQHEQGTLRKVVEEFLGGGPEGPRLVTYRQASPTNYAGNALPPLLLIYGVEDSQVPVGSTDRFVGSLRDAGHRDVSYHRLATVGHCPYSLMRVSWLQQVVNEFFERTLRPPAARR